MQKKRDPWHHYTQRASRANVLEAIDIRRSASIITHTPSSDDNHMATITCFSRTGQKLTTARQLVVRKVEHVEKKAFPRHEAFDFATELRKRSLELNVILNDEVSMTNGEIVLVAYTKNTNLVNLHKICVQESFRRQGIGQKLLFMQIEKLRRRGATKVQLWVDENNLAARLLYEKAGFEEVRRLEDCYISGRTGIQMIKNLI